MKKVLLAMLGGFTCLYAFADDLVRISNSSGGTEFNLYSDTMHSVADGSVEGWELLNFSKPQLIHGKKYQSTKVLMRRNCNRQQQAVMQIAYYEGVNGSKGIVYDSGSKYPKWINVIPDTNSDYIQKLICEAKSRKEVKN